MKVLKVALGEQIKEQLMDDILSGVYKSGDRLVESALAQSFGTSQAPVREALKALEEMGLVILEPYKGTTVREITTQDIYETLTVRAALEACAAGLAAQHRTQSDIESLGEILDAIDVAVKSGDADERLRLNKLFHDEIIRASGHKLIMRLSKTLRFAGWSHFKAKQLMGDAKINNTAHRKIYQAIVAGDQKAAEEAMREHEEEFVPSLEAAKKSEAEKRA